MRPRALIFVICLVCNASGLPAPEIDIDNPTFTERKIKSDGSADWSRVVGGSAAATGQFPYVASLRRSNSHFCGASIVSSVYLITAAHSTVGVTALSLTAVVGTTTLNSGGTAYSISRIVSHDGFDSATAENDIALLKASSTIGGGGGPLPIGTFTVGSGVTVTLSGWGRTVTGGSLPNDLQFINLVTISNTECAERHGANPIFESSLCTFTRSGEGACNGDSGGPLVANDVLVGLVSWGRPCAAGYPDVFTRMSSYISWIQWNAT